LSNGQSLHLELLVPQILNHRNVSTEIFCQKNLLEKIITFRTLYIILCLRFYYVYVFMYLLKYKTCILISLLIDARKANVIFDMEMKSRVLHLTPGQ